MGRLLSLPESGPLRHPVRILRNFVGHRGLVRAASLSYTTLLALVPLTALVLAVSKGLLSSQDAEFLPRLIDRFLNYAVPQLQYLSAAEASAARQDVFARIQEAIERINAGALGVFGAVTLVSVGITLLSAVESALNNVWGVARGRSLGRRVVYYWAGVTLGPLVIFFSIGLSSSGLLTTMLGQLPGGLVAAFYRFLLPFLVLAIGFTLLYWSMPYTPVPMRAAFCGGICAAALFQANNLVSALYFSQVVSYSRVYGSLGAIPVLMVGLYFAWVIVLVGAEVAYAVATPVEETIDYPAGLDGRAEIALEVARVATARFLAGEGGASAVETAEALSLPLDWVNRSLETLCAASLLVSAEPSDDRPQRFLPARPPSTITAIEVLDAVRRPPGEETALSRPAPAVTDFLARLRDAERRELSGLTLEALARSSGGDAP